MGQVVFNSKICDHAEWCPAKTACERLLGVNENEAPIYYDKVTKKITLDGKKCAIRNCVERACTRQCQHFKYAYTLAEKWQLEQEVSQFEEDPEYNFIPRFNAGGCPKHTRLDYSSLVELIEFNNSFLIVEITNPRSSVSLSEGIKYSQLMSDVIYHRYYKKLLIEDMDILQNVEERFGINELPILMFFYKNNCVGSISGIFKNSDVNQVEEMKKRVQAIIQKYCYS